MISITISRAELELRDACDAGMDLFDDLAAAGGTDVVRVEEWTPLHDAWLSVAYPGFSRWLRSRGLIPCASLYGADLRDANLRGSDLYGADLTRASLSGADLTGASLRDANLYSADLTGADLRGASLRDANLYSADLSGADLRGASLRDADLTRADLTGAKRYSSEPPIPGWRTSSGRLEREVFS